MVGWGLWTQRAARIASRDNVESIRLVDTATQGVEAPIPMADLCLAGAHGASARRKFPLGTTVRSRRTQGLKYPIPGS